MSNTVSSKQWVVSSQYHAASAGWSGTQTSDSRFKDSKFKIQNSMNWTELETSTHQDHVIKHVLGATVLGWCIAGEAAHLLLDIGFLWTIYLDGEMNLLPQGVAISELEGGELTSVDRTELAFDADMLLAEGREATDLKRFTARPSNA
jgi:hypothetical protein